MPAGPEPQATRRRKLAADLVADQLRIELAAARAAAGGAS
jgi:hypothetical protein